jgi:hypothetical protein
MSACSGTPPIAAISLTARQSALQPTGADRPFERKCTPFHHRVGFEQLPAGGASEPRTAQSSPGPDAHLGAEFSIGA